MAVTIHQEPKTYNPSGNPLMWVFSSDQTAQSNFSYLIEVYVNGNLIERNKVFPESGIYARWNGTAVAEKYCSLPVRPNAAQGDASNHEQMYIKVIELYGAPPIEQADATSTTIKMWKAKLNDTRFFEWQTNFDEYVLTSGTAAIKFLTWWPRTQKYYCGLTQQVRLMLITDDGCDKIEIRLHDAIDDTVASVIIPVNPHRVTVFDLSPVFLIANTVLTQSDFDNCVYWTGRAYHTISGDESETFRIDKENRCQESTAQRIHFMNTLGGLDSANFNLHSKTSGNLKRHGYEKDFGALVGSSYSFTPDLGRSIDYQVERNGNLQINTDWIGELEQQWMVDQLYISTLIYLELAAFSRVKIMGNSFKYKYTKADTQYRESLKLFVERFTSVSV